MAHRHAAALALARSAPAARLRRIQDPFRPPDQVGRFADRKGLFVLAQSGPAMEIRNDARFQPRTW
ncbi:MAG: hypothetical protein VBE63_13055 [Lamprobacter sp.]|uniref:hypothetical protein n=1 Tax=Lamprobacter sp. TaxID=3100796 RepID=UPI002B263729|nr:hypothetical protein [Lamprobacter sp.]MEA3640857.1 hypothetical protein [Lamprobacter sp.]